MSNFPEIQGFEAHEGAGFSELSEKEIASREKELLGEDMAAEIAANAHQDTAQSEASDDEFISASPAGETNNEPAPADVAEESSESAFISETTSDPAKPGAGPSAYIPQDVDLTQSEFLKEWETKRDLEIERRDKYSREVEESTQEKARKAIDDFYENYNAKREKEIATIREDAEEFEKKRDADIGDSKGTTWSLAASLIEGLNSTAENVQPADKKRFLQLIESLKDDVKAPGAAGY